MPPSLRAGPERSVRRSSPCREAAASGWGLPSLSPSPLGSATLLGSAKLLALATLLVSATLLASAKLLASATPLRFRSRGRRLPPRQCQCRCSVPPAARCKHP